eukprot:Phypoly_transcript_00213.p1 GENE.Phypoly_transcript_00213~~Phypoly_transcript_00213.p1  ORF type:complete len:1213 (+),score=186.63 Phypoly_transcript_00213:2250-5888(+)
MLVKQFYEGKSVLITGATGFIGKVVLEKLLRDVPNIGTIYIIVRRSDSTPKQRFEDEVVASRVFDTLRDKLRDDFIPFVTTKVVPIGGDLSQHNIGMSSEDMATIIKNVNVVIHLAASIDFKERLDKAVESNVLGTLRLFNLAKKFAQLQAFVHCSTAYVNCNRSDGLIDESLPPLAFDPEEMVRVIMAKHKSQIESFSDKLLAKYQYPNTYTFTKAISEHILSLRRGNMPLYFVRPTIVGATLKEPFPGWVDSVAAVGAVILYVGVGVVHFIKGKSSVEADIIPCDHVANVLIVAAPLVAGQDRLRICHVGTTTTNPETWHNAGYYVDAYWHQHIPKKSIGVPSFTMHDSQLVYETRFFFNYTAPSTLYSIYATLFGSAKQKKDSERFNKLVKASRLINDTFIHFTSNGWAFSTKNLLAAYQELDEEDRRVFFADTKEINWKSYYDHFCFGLHKYMLKEEGVKPPSQVLSTNLVTMDDIISQKNYIHWIFADVSWAVTSYKHITEPPVQPHATAEIKSMVLTSKTVKDVIATLAAKHGLPLETVEKRAITTLDRIAGTITLSCVRFMAWFLKKLWRRLYTALHIDERGLQRVREAIKKAPVVLIPTHRSYLDFLILSYVFFAYNLPMPRIAAGEDFLSVFIVRWIFKNCGAFFLRRTFDGDALYWAVFAEYVEQLVIEHDPIEFFIEGKRSRSGKSLHPKLGMLNMTMAPFLDEKVHDLQIVPISISYDKVLEGELYTQEMMGESKAKESLNGLLRASKVLRMKWGSINVVFAPPISAKQYADDFIANRIEPARALPQGAPTPDPYHNENDRRDLLHDLSYHIVSVLDKNIVITSTAVVATVLLAGRRGISRDELVTKCDWLREEIYNRGAEVAFEGAAETMVDYALKLLSNLIQKRRNMYEPTQSVEDGGQKSSPVPNSNYRKNILVLSYYRNQLLHLFQWEGAIAIVIAALAGMKSSRKKKLPIHDGATGVEEGVMIEEATFLAKLWSSEFVNHPNTDFPKAIMRALDKMTADGVIIRHTVSEQPNPDAAPVTQRLYKISSRGEGILTFLCQMFWPYVETYFIACLTLFTTSPDAIKPNVLAQRMGWLGEKMFDEGKLNFFESCNIEILNNAISLFVRMGILTKKPVIVDINAGDRKKKDKKSSSEALGKPIPRPPPDLFLAPPYASKNGALGEFAKHIGKYRKTSPVTTKTTDLAIALLEDFPLVARL